MLKICHRFDKEKQELKFALQTENAGLTSSLYLQKDAETTIGGSFRGAFHFCLPIPLLYNSHIANNTFQLQILCEYVRFCAEFKATVSSICITGTNDHVCKSAFCLISLSSSK